MCIRDRRYGDRISNPGVLGALPVKEKAYLGHLYPTTLLGLHTRLTLSRSLTLDLLGEGQYGMLRYIGPAHQNTRRSQWPLCYAIQDVWANGDRSTLTSSQVGQCVGSKTDSDYWTNKADFFKLRSASLSYRLPDGLVPGASSAQLTIQGKNLLTYKGDYVGIDPEANDRRRSSPFEYYNSAPPRVFLINVTINF